MILNDDFTFEELENKYFECTKHLDNSPRSKMLKRAIRARIYGLYLRKNPIEIIKEVDFNGKKE